MSRLPRAVRQALTIARRDFVATVFTPIFLLFLFAPVVMGAFGAIGGMGAASVSDGAADKARVVAIAAPREAALLREADGALRRIFPHDARPPVLEIRAPSGDGDAQARAALATPGVDVVAAMAGPLDRPHILRVSDAQRSGDYLAALADRAVGVTHSIPRIAVVVRERPSARTRGASAFFAVFGVFFLTLFLSGQVVGTMAEERNNKVI